MERLVACKTCGLVQRLGALSPDAVAVCSRCGSVLVRHTVNSLGRTAAFSLAALMFYVPANVYPILQMELYGAHSENTVLDGCVTLFQQGQRLVAVIVFLASLLIPFLKLVGLFYLVVTTRSGSRRRRLERTWVYRIIDVIGPWAMLDVFLLSVLVALVKLGELATVMPGRGLVAFTAVVVFTLLATTSFDPRLIWERPDDAP
jgi:paraquat-inducible protein A